MPEETPNSAEQKLGEILDWIFQHYDHAMRRLADGEAAHDEKEGV